MSLGTNIKLRRYALHMTQAELASILGYKTKSTIAKIESGENGISTNKLPLFARALDTTVDALLTGVERQETVPPAMGTQTKNIAIILAGGKISQNLQNIPNQFVTVLDKPIIIYAMEAYQRHPAIHEIYAVCLRGWEDILSSYANQYGITKLAGIIPAGKTGIQSVKNSVDYLKNRCTGEEILIFQESTRPLITEDVISKLLGACREKGSAVTCESMAGITQFYQEPDRVRYMNRNCMVEAQSPDAYQFAFLSDALKLAQSRGAALDESCGYMFFYNMGYPLHFIEGNHNNLKIHRQEDITILTALMKAAKLQE